MMTRAKTLATTVLAAAVIGCGSGASTPAPVPSSTGTSATATDQMSGYVPYEPMTVDPSSATASTAITCATTTSSTATTNTTSTTPQPTALSVDKASTGIFSVSMVDLPNPDVKEIWVTVLEVSYHIAGQGWAVLSDFTTDGGKPVDLLHLQDYAMALGFATLPAGTTITQIRLLIQSDISTGSGVGDQKINQVVLWDATHTKAGDSFPLKTPSGYESGVKIMGPWTIQGCTKTEVTIDFDGKKSIWYHPTGHETDPYGTEWILRPVIRVKGVITGPTDCTVPATSGTPFTPPPPPGTITPISPPPPPVTPVPPGSIPIGGTCTAGTDCSSGTCTGSVCVAPPGSVSVGGSCLIGAECSSGSSCTAGVCVATGGSGGTGSSGTIPNGGACTTGPECSSGTCTGSICVAPSGSVTVGGSCSIGAECSSGTCTGSICVAPPGTVSVGGSCLIGPECSTGSCVGSTCAAVGATSTCSVPAECLSNSCYPNNTCAASAAGGKCNKDSDCTTGTLCDGGTCATPPATLAPLGSSCTLPAECLSNQCYAGSGSVSQTCQPGIQGSACYSGSDCTTGMYCDTSACTVTGTGTCMPSPVHMSY